MASSIVERIRVAARDGRVLVVAADTCNPSVAYLDAFLQFVQQIIVQNAGECLKSVHVVFCPGCDAAIRSEQAVTALRLPGAGIHSSQKSASSVMSNSTATKGEFLSNVGTAHVVAAGCVGAAVGAGLAWILAKQEAAAAKASSSSKRPCCDAKATSESKSDSSGKKKQQLSTTSSDHDGNVYETDGAVNEYLFFHYGSKEEFLPYNNGPTQALDFPVRTAEACIEWSKNRLASEPTPSKTRALDLGCAVGATSFKLSEAFDEVVGIDFSNAFVKAASRLQTEGKLPFTYLQEAEVWRSGTASRPAGAKTDRIKFMQGDACNLDVKKLGGPFHVVHGANLLCRLPNPDDLLKALPSLVADDGVVVFISPYSWLEQYTPRDCWLGGRSDDPSAAKGDGGSSDGLVRRMASLGFKRVHRSDEPFLIREHARKFQWGCSELAVFYKDPAAAAGGDDH